MSTQPYHVIFVCLGNICRSPAAENIFRHHVQQAGLEDLIRIDAQRLLVIQSGQDDIETPNTISIIQNWYEEHRDN